MANTVQEIDETVLLVVLLGAVAAAVWFLTQRQQPGGAQTPGELFNVGESSLERATDPTDIAGSLGLYDALDPFISEFGNSPEGQDFRSDPGAALQQAGIF